MDLLLENNDIVFVNGECPVTHTKKDVVAQRLKITLQTFLEEWFLNLDVGIPYFQRVFQKNSNKTSVDAIFQQAIIDDPGVVELLSYNSTLNSTARGFSLEFEVRVVDNTTVPVSLTTFIGV